MEALLNTSTMEQATEYLLTHPPPLLGGAVRVRIHTHTEKHYSFFESFVFNLLSIFVVFFGTSRI